MEIISISNQHNSNKKGKSLQKNKINKENKIKNCLFQSPTTKKGNQSDNDNNQVEFNCNCIGKYSYKNTEAITIINNNTNDNNIINTYYTTCAKTSEKNENTNNKTINAKNSKNEINSDVKNIINENKIKNLSNSLNHNN